MTSDEIDIAVITDVSDIPAAFHIVWTCFGEQTPDAILGAFNPKWGTPDGYSRAVQRMKQSFENATTRDKNGDRIQLFLKATATDAGGNRRIVGFAVWIELSVVAGHGQPPLLDGREALDLDELYPNDASEQNYCATLFENLHRQRHELMEQQSSASPPAVMALDMCAVHPEFQRRGIASKLVQYGLNEAERRGGLVCCTEATTMGRSVYAKLGFRQHATDIAYGVEGAQFARNGMPSNVFMRTQMDA